MSEYMEMQGRGQWDNNPKTNKKPTNCQNVQNLSNPSSKFPTDKNHLSNKFPQDWKQGNVCSVF